MISSPSRAVEAAAAARWERSPRANRVATPCERLDEARVLDHESQRTVIVAVCGVLSAELPT